MADPFEVRVDFLRILKKGLDASQRSIQIAINHALPNFPRCGEDLWDCIMEALEEVNINQRMNIFYFLDSLCDACQSIRPLPTPAGPTRSYVTFIERDLNRVVEYVTPEGRTGLPNLTSVKGILENWITKQIIDVGQISNVLTTLNARTVPDLPLPVISTDADSGPASAAIFPTSAFATSASPSKAMSRDDIFKRIEADRERHKRLREKRWVQPIPQTLGAAYQLVSCTLAGDGHLDAEFEDAWETTSDWNEDDDEAALEEACLCFPPNETPIDVT